MTVSVEEDNLWATGSADMRSLLVPVDGSPPSLRALDYAIAEAKALGADAVIHLINVQPPVPAAVSEFVGRRKLVESGVTFRTAFLVGSAGESIAHYAKTSTIDEIAASTAYRACSSDRCPPGFSPSSISR
jgi:hypothetical protein